MRKGYRYWLGSLLVVVLAAGLYVAGSGRVALWDRDEGWYAQASRQMLEGGNWVVPHFLDRARFAKPILIYWCQGASMYFFGVNSFAARLPSAIGMTLTVLLLALVIGWGLGARRGMWTALIFASSAMVIISAKMCLTDAVMMVFITGAQLCLFGIYIRRTGRHGPLVSGSGLRVPGSGGGEIPNHGTRNPEPGARSTNKLAVVMWVCVGLAGLTKGPFALVVIFASMVALAFFDVGRRWRSRTAWRAALGWWKSVRPVWGVIIIILVVAPWLISFAVTNPHALWEMLQEPFKHMATDQDGHAQPPGYFLATIWLTLFPWSLLLPVGLVLGWKHRKTPTIRYALAIILGNWVFVEFFMLTKLPHYLLPSYAAMAFLIATALLRCMRGQHRGLTGTSFMVGVGGWAMAAALLSVVPWMAAGFFPGEFSHTAAWAFTAAGLVYAFLVMALFMQHKVGRAATTMGLGMMGVVAVLFMLYLPSARFLQIPQRVGSELAAVGAKGDGDVVMTDYNEPTVAFYTRGMIKDGTEDYFKKHAADVWPEWVILTRRAYERLPADDRDLLKTVAQFRGWDYADGGRIVDVMVAKKLPVATAQAPTRGE